MRELNVTETAVISGGGVFGAIVGGTVGYVVGTLVFGPLFGVAISTVAAGFGNDIEDRINK